MNKKLIFITLSLFTLIGYGYFVYAAAPVGGYAPGETLNPDCAPNDVDCLVTLPSGGSVTADNGLTAISGNVQLGGTLLQNTTIDQNGKDFTLTNGNFSFISGYDAPFDARGFTQRYTNGNRLQLIGLANDGSSSTTILGDVLDITDKDSLAALISITNMNRVSLHSGNLNASNGPSSDIELDSGIGISYNNVVTTGQHSYFNMNEYGQLFESQDSNTGNSSGYTIRPNNGISFIFGGHKYTFPRTDGLANQVLTTDGAGQLSWQNAGGGSGWSLTGNSGTTAGTNFIGTTDAQDFMVKTNGNQIALFGQNGNVAIGGYDQDSNSQYTGAVQATGLGAIALGGSLDYSSGGSPLLASGLLSVALGNQNTASGFVSTAFGNANIASGANSTAFGSNTEATGQLSTTFGGNTYARSYGETVFGLGSTDYAPLDDSGFNAFDRLFSIGNNNLLLNGHNAYTLFKDGSFAYNDDNFQNDNPGTEQNMFYFNFGNHNGLGSPSNKKAIRLGATSYDEWDLTSSNVGDKSIAIGFADTSGATPAGIASGDYSITLGLDSYAGGLASFAFGSGSSASGDYSVALGLGAATNGKGSLALVRGYAEGEGAFAVNGRARGDYSAAIGATTRSYYEVALGRFSTPWIASSADAWVTDDRLLNIGNGTGVGSESDALTILKNGQTGIAIDNFEANSNGNIFQVGDGSTGIIGYVDNGTGNWMAVSDERKKHNIIDISYGLTEILKLKPVSFDYNRNNEHTIGFLAQQVLPIIPEAVGGDEEKGYSMSYATITPALVKAIQELNLKVDTLQLTNGTTSSSIFESLKQWLGDVGNGIQKIFAHEVQTDKLCVGNTCVTESQLQQLLQNQNSSTENVNSTGTSPTTVSPSTDPVPDPIVSNDTTSSTQSGSLDNTSTTQNTDTQSSGDSTGNSSINSL